MRGHVVVAYSSSNVVANNVVDEGAIEIYGYSSTGNLVVSNHVSTSESVGIIADGYLSDVRIERNVVEGGGIILYNAFESEVQRNRLSSDGIWVADSSGIRVLDNEVTGPPTPLANGRTGGIAVAVNAHDVDVARNTVSGSIDGVVVGDSTGTILERNSLYRNDVDGIRIEADARSAVASRNVVRRNGDDGIDVDDPGNTLVSNVASLNGDLGIEAVPGTIDGGRNGAFGNGNPLQCLNVDCKITGKKN